jgi:hypothetical protein
LIYLNDINNKESKNMDTILGYREGRLDVMRSEIGYYKIILHEIAEGNIKHIVTKEFCENKIQELEKRIAMWLIC